MERRELMEIGSAPNAGSHVGKRPAEAAMEFLSNTSITTIPLALDDLYAPPLLPANRRETVLPLPADAPAAARKPSPSCLTTSSDAVIGEGSMELELLGSLQEEAKTCNAEDFGTFRRGFEARLQDFEVAVAQTSACEAAQEVSMDSSIYCIRSGEATAPDPVESRGTEIDTDRDSEPENAPPATWSSLMEEMHARTCGCNDIGRHFRRSVRPERPRSRSSSKQPAAQPRQGRAAWA
jgi:hypothetical protein